MGIVKAIVEKLKIKELFAVVFVGSIIITLLPVGLAQRLKINEFRNTYQTYISICIIAIGSYYFFVIIQHVKDIIWSKFHNPKKIAINYMVKTITPDEMWLLVETFYDKDNHQFRSSGMIEYSDGRKTALESKFILYRASSMSEWYSFAYNLQPYAYEFLNKNLREGNITITGNSIKYKLS